MKFVAFERAKQGTGASRRLRNAGKTPGIVYGGEGQQPQLIELDHNALWHALKKEAFHSSILEMEMGGNVSKVLLRDVQYHPFKQLVQHVDFQRVDARTRLTVKVPLHFKGEEESEAVKLHHNLVNHVMTEIEISVLPADLPEFIEVDLSGLTNAATVHVSDLKLPKGAKVILHGKPNPVVASAVAPVVEEEAPAAAPAPAAEPAKGKKKK
ncbi:50S ribosomal protein L25/general stress protein Ctc [Xenophilus sp. Marseille-Q4582]|uniref:50S ribosomal protein L25/general stress protein Ctc n=1 Tax=Xenophilus sp. Marseille-Q4582 TaxID=2866600 RepID=UPI001CE40586|nr:50S ribosomal protein L25/general stress protein Ctc [Xenophilus sp. Marseille-Q4582]